MCVSKCVCVWEFVVCDMSILFISVLYLCVCMHGSVCGWCGMSGYVGVNVCDRPLTTATTHNLNHLNTSLTVSRTKVVMYLNYDY